MRGGRNAAPYPPRRATVSFRFEIESVGAECTETLRRNAASCRLKRLRKRWFPRLAPLAIVGAGPSVLANLDRLKAWPGYIWGINSMAAWLGHHGIAATMVTIDPAPLANFDIRGVERAYLATSVHPDLQAALPQALAFDLAETSPEGLPGGVTTAARAPGLGLRLGYVDMTLFGCEGSYRGGMNRVYDSDDTGLPYVVRAGGRDYITCMEWELQCRALADLVAMCGGALKNASGGLLQAMIDDPDEWAVVAVSGAMRDHLEARNGKHGLYDGQYVEAA